MKKKFLCSLLSVAMVLSMGTFASAAEFDEIYVSGDGGETELLEEGFAGDLIEEAGPFEENMLGSTGLDLPTTIDEATMIDIGMEYTVYPQNDGSGNLRAFCKFETQKGYYFTVKAVKNAGASNYADYSIYDKNKNLVASDDLGSSMKTIFSVNDNGTYYIEFFVNNKTEPTRYGADFVVNRYEDPEGDVPAGAYTLSEGTAYDGRIVVDKDVDYLKIAPAKTGNYHIKISNKFDGAMNYSYVGESGEPSWQYISSEKSIELGKTLYAGKTYYIAVKCYNKNQLPIYSVQYDLIADNPTKDTARELAFDGKDNIINFSGENLEYWYKFTTSKESDIISAFNIKCGEKTIRYELQDAKGAKVAGDLNKWFYGGNTDAYSTRDANVTFYLVLKARDSEASSATVTLNAYSDPEGDTTNESFKLNEKDVHSTGIGNVDLTDYYKITTDVEGKYKFTINNSSDDRIDYAIYEADGISAVKDKDGKSINGSIAAQKNEIFKANLKEGKDYYVCLISSAKKYGNYNITYALDFNFTDVTLNRSNWKFKAANYCYANGIMSGTNKEGTNFAPDAMCTRAEMVTILYNASDKLKKSTRPMNFTDVAPGHWSYPAVDWAYSNGITAGISADKFGTNDPVTREQVAAFFYNYANKYLGIGCGERADLNATFTDAGDIHTWAKDALSWANANKIVNGDGKGHVNPRKNATRAEIATMVMNYLKKYNGI